MEFCLSEFWCQWNSSWILFRISRAVTHCAFSSILFHGQIVQTAILQLSDPGNKKCSPWKVFTINHPQTPRLLSRRGPRSQETRLSQHYISQKMTFQNFNISAEKSFQAWYNGFPALIKMPHDFCKLQPQKLYENVQEPFCQSWKLFSAEILKIWNVIFWLM